MENRFLKGIKDGFPICMGYFAVSIAFGIFAVANGLTSFEAFMISLTNVTSAGQLAAVPIFMGGTLAEMALSQLVINLRYSLMSVALSQKFDKNICLFDRFILAFVNTDEVFAVAVSKKQVGRNYMYGLIILPVVGWVSGTLVGALMGSILPQLVVQSLGVAIYGMFIAIVIPPARRHLPTAVCVILAVALSTLFYYLNVLSSGFTVIICAGVSALVMAVISPLKEGEDE